PGREGDPAEVVFQLKVDRRQQLAGLDVPDLVEAFEVVLLDIADFLDGQQTSLAGEVVALDGQLRVVDDDGVNLLLLEGQDLDGRLLVSAAHLGDGVPSGADADVAGIELLGPDRLADRLEGAQVDHPELGRHVLGAGGDDTGEGAGGGWVDDAAGLGEVDLAG